MDTMGTTWCGSKSETKHSWMNLKERDNVGSGFLPTTPVWESKNISEKFLKMLFGKSRQTHNSCPDLPAWKRLSSWLLTDDCSFSCLLSQKVSPQRAGNLFGHRVQPAPLTPVITSLLSPRDHLDFNLFKMVQRAIIWALIRLPSTFQSTQAIKFPSDSVLKLNIANYVWILEGLFSTSMGKVFVCSCS